MKNVVKSAKIIAVLLTIFLLLQMASCTPSVYSSVKIAGYEEYSFEKVAIYYYENEEAQMDITTNWSSGWKGEQKPDENQLAPYEKAVTFSVHGYDGSGRLNDTFYMIYNTKNNSMYFYEVVRSFYGEMYSQEANQAKAWYEDVYEDYGYTHPDSDFTKNMSTAKLAGYEDKYWEEQWRLIYDSEIKDDADYWKDKKHFSADYTFTWIEGWKGEYAPLGAEGFLLENEIPVTFIIEYNEVEGDTPLMEKTFYYLAYNTKTGLLYPEAAGYYYSGYKGEHEEEIEKSTLISGLDKVFRRTKDYYN